MAESFDKVAQQIQIAQDRGATDRSELLRQL